MSRTISRGKQQVLLNYLPGRIFDFAGGTVARAVRIRGRERTDLNGQHLLRAIGEVVRAWPEEQRTVFRDPERTADKFVFLEPRSVDAQMYPLVFWCQNRSCGQVVSRHSDLPSGTRCSRCSTGRLAQIRWVKVHRCGALDPLTPPSCERCPQRRTMALDDRGSERLEDFRWVCRTCGDRRPLFAGNCRACAWPGTDPAMRLTRIMVHRSGPTFFAHPAVLLNLPSRELDGLFAAPRWQAVAAARHLDLPEVRGRRLVDFGNSTARASSGGGGLSEVEKARLRERGLSVETISEFERMQAMLHADRTSDAEAASPSGVADALVAATRVAWPVWERAGQELLEAVLPLESGQVSSISSAGPVSDDRSSVLRRMGVERATLVSEFPITTAVFGYSRIDYRPNTCWINAFPADPEQGGRFPVFVNTTAADAIMIRLDPLTVVDWIRSNRIAVTLAAAASQSLAASAYFVELFDGLQLRETLTSDLGAARMAFGLLHSLSHLLLRQASLLCGLEATSLSEYLLPRAMTLALYCPHHAGATIGAVSALFEQSLVDWLNRCVASRRCVYDPVCREAGGACHACSHASETSCRYFNVNLGRQFLFGGEDPHLGRLEIGYLDFARARARNP